MESVVLLKFLKHLSVQGSCKEVQDSDAENPHSLPFGKTETTKSYFVILHIIVL